ncbi:hypothetical protein CsatB_021224 [Cannabis sativa]
MEPVNRFPSLIAEQYESLNIEDEEETGILYEGGDEELSDIDDRWVLVGRFLTKRSIDFQAMQNKMAVLWQPGRGMYVKELEHNLYLFQFYHEVDIERVMEGSPWTFDRVPLIFERLKQGENPRTVMLNKLEFWIQIHNLTTGFMSERVIRDLGNYLGSFVKSDPNNFIGVWRDFFRVRVKINIDKPLKRKKKLERIGGIVCYAQFKYEDLSTFCFICGILGHSERFCEKLFDTPLDEIEKPYNLELKAAPRRKNHTIGARWLRPGSVNNSGGFSATGGTSTTSEFSAGRGVGRAGKASIGGSGSKNQGSSFTKPIIVEREEAVYKEVHADLVGGSIDQHPKDIRGKSHSQHTDEVIMEYNGEDSLVILENKRRRKGQVSLQGNLDNVGLGLSNLGPADNSKLLGDGGIMDFEEENHDNTKNLSGAGVFVVEAQGSAGGLAFLWKNQDYGSIVGFSKNHIDFVVESTEKGRWRLTGIYGEPVRAQRKDTWDLLRFLARDSSLPWCILGDLNNIAHHEEKKGGRRYPQQLIDGFCEAMEDCGLEDMDLVGHPFTWEKGRGTDNWIESRLDRALVNSLWTQVFSLASLFNLEFSSSDHCPLWLETEVKQVFHPNKKFKFENAWLKEPMCYEIVKNSWNLGAANLISEKLNQCAISLGEWGKEVTGNFKLRIRKCKKELKALKNLRDPVAVQRYSEVKKNLFLVLDQREAFWKQRAKQLWLKEGDHNSSYFHKMASSRKRHNQIQKLKNDNGEWVNWDNGLPTVVTNYFNGLFHASGSACQEIVDSVDTRVSSFANIELQQHISEEEVKKAVFQMHPDKSPGPDGMTPAFYQKCWSIVGRDVVETVRSFFRSGDFEQNCGDANIVLIPKTKNPSDMTQLRPIALCNVLYKIITKVMVNRMKPFMDEIITENQSAFIPGRLISDNILVSFEVLHYLKRKRKGKEGFMALKLDMSKAYDRIEWPFLESMLRKLGFVDWWVRLLLKCVSSARYTVVHGNHEMGPILPSRGIRQGDPLSPYLFILCAEGLSAILRKFESRGLIHGCKVANGAPRITHMLFADDSYLYCKATTVEATRIQEVLSKFEAASGQKVNLSKSSIFFSSNTDSATQHNISNQLGMNIADEKSLYLGLPSTMSRNKSAVLGFLKERVRKRIQGWESKFLSRAGKEVLIKTVAQSLPSYAMSVFLLPLEITRDMEKVMTKFWWQSSNKNGKGIHWLSWDRLCTHKDKGGMGFRHLRDFNLAMLGKQGWRLVVRPHSLVAKIFKARYFPNDSYLSASLGNNPSFVWRSVWEAQQLVRKGVQWCIGDGSQINVLNEPWLPCHENPFVTSSHPALGNALLQNLMGNDGSWDQEVLTDLFNARDRELILKIPLFSSVVDRLVWQHESSGIYSVKSAYNLQQVDHGRWHDNPDAEAKFWSSFWRLKLPPKIKNLVWRACRNCLPTLCQLRTKRVNIFSSCPVCQGEEETILHALVTCPKVQIVWNRVGIGTRNGSLNGSLSTDDMNSFYDWFVHIFSGENTANRLLMCALCWAIWDRRNEMVWKKKESGLDSIVMSAKGYLDHWTSAQNSLIETSWTGLQSGDGAELWCPPTENSIKINVDAAMFDGGNSYGIGLVARDRYSPLVEAKMECFLGRVNPEVAEAIGVREALSWIKNRNWPRVVVETDCLTVVQALRSSVHMISLFGQIINECKQLMLELSHVSVFFVKRSANVVAHSFARASHFHSGCIFDLENVPIELLPCLVTEFDG